MMDLTQEVAAALQGAEPVSDPGDIREALTTDCWDEDTIAVLSMAPTWLAGLVAEVERLRKWQHRAAGVLATVDTHPCEDEAEALLQAVTP